jgi:hypothetical protein
VLNGKFFFFIPGVGISSAGPWSAGWSEIARPIKDFTAQPGSFGAGTFAGSSAELSAGDQPKKAGRTK